MKIALLLATVLFGLVTSLNAGLSITFLEVGNDVVATSDGGSLNLSALTKSGDSSNQSLLWPNPIAVWIGGSGSVPVDFYNSVSITGSFSPGSNSQFLPDSTSGPLIGTYGTLSNSELVVPDGYVSGTTLAVSTSTWLNTSFADLAITEGDQVVYSWGSGATADSMTVNIGPVPEPAATVAVVSIGCAFVLLFRNRKRLANLKGH